jgi:hypothetical protein
MNGLWIAVMVAGLVAVGVAAQLGWELRFPDVKRAFNRGRAHDDSAPGPLSDGRGPAVRPGM